MSSWILFFYWPFSSLKSSHSLSLLLTPGILVALSCCLEWISILYTDGINRQGGESMAPRWAFNMEDIGCGLTWRGMDFTRSTCNAEMNSSLPLNPEGAGQVISNLWIYLVMRLVVMKIMILIKQKCFIFSTKDDVNKHWNIWKINNFLVS